MRRKKVSSLNLVELKMQDMAEVSITSRAELLLFGPIITSVAKAEGQAAHGELCGCDEASVTPFPPLATLPSHRHLITKLLHFCYGPSSPHRLPPKAVDRLRDMEGVHFPEENLIASKERSRLRLSPEVLERVELYKTEIARYSALILYCINSLLLHY